MIFRRCALVLGMAPCLYPCVTTSSLNAALPFDQRPQSVRAFAGHSQFANIKVHTQRNNMPSLYESLSTFSAQESCRGCEAFQAKFQVHSGYSRRMQPHSAHTHSTAFAAVYVVILPLVCVIPASQMLRACSYEVAGDMTSPRLASLIERARTASVPKVSHQHASHPPFALHCFTIQTEILKEFLWIVCRRLLSAQ
jgi:hypothetical protein